MPIGLRSCGDILALLNFLLLKAVVNMVLVYLGLYVFIMLYKGVILSSYYRRYVHSCHSKPPFR
jgi:hypothetical protein